MIWFICFQNPFNKGFILLVRECAATRCYKKNSNRQADGSGQVFHMGIMTENVWDRQVCWISPYRTPLGQVKIPLDRRLTSPPQHVFLTLFRVHSVDAKRPLSVVSGRSDRVSCPRDIRVSPRVTERTNSTMARLMRSLSLIWYRSQMVVISSHCNLVSMYFMSHAHLSSETTLPLRSRCKSILVKFL